MKHINTSYNRNYNKIVSDIFNCSYNQYDNSISQDDIKLRAILMSGVEWCPINEIPNNLGKFDKGKKIIGLPYSSVKELQKFIGLDVSIYTFLTAVRNPHSLLYSEDVAKGKPCYLGGVYNGINSHTFYGTVCSSFTAFCYGENNNYTSYNYKNGLVPNYYHKQEQSLDSVSSCDLLWSPGHVALITDIEKDSVGNILSIQLFESSGTKVYSVDYTPTAFARRMSGNGNPQRKAYIYGNKLVDKVAGNNNLPTIENIQSIIHDLSLGNPEICTWFGDKPCIGEWDKVMINFKKGRYDKINISLNGEIIDTLDISGADNSIEYKIKGIGLYKAQLASDTLVSPHYTSFEVIDTSTKCHQNNNGSWEVFFANDSNPETIYWIDKSGDQLSFPINVPEEAKLKGRMTIMPCGRKDGMLRVIYRGNYGRAINKPYYLFQ